VLRIVVDTNVRVSAPINRLGAPARVRLALEARRFVLVTSLPLLAELAEVLARPRIARKYEVSTADATELLALLRARGEVVTVTGALQVCRGPDDNIVIETAPSGRADALVTRDDDLKDAEEVAAFLEPAGVRVLSVRRFLALLDEQPA
jgi:uncharacterized protein